MPTLSRRSVLATTLGTTAMLAAPAIAQAKPVKLGAVLPFSGGLELFGGQARLGIDLAVAELNAAGGLLGRPVEVIYEDNRTDPKTSVERATKLIGRDEVLAILGPITSSARDAMVPTIARQRAPLLYATNYEGGFCGEYKFSFNTVPNQELGKLIPYLARNKGDSFYFFGADYIWPQQMLQATQNFLAAENGRLVGQELTPFGVKEFAPVIRRIADSGAKVLIFALPGADGITFIRQAEDLGLLKQLTVGFLGFCEPYLGAFGENKGQDMWVTVPLVASSPAPAVQAFTGKIRAMAGNDAIVSHYVLTHWLAVHALAKAVAAKGEVSREAVASGLPGIVVDGPTGKVTIGAERHATLPMFLARTEGAGLVTVQDLGEIAPLSGCF